MKKPSKLKLLSPYAASAMPVAIMQTLVMRDAVGFSMPAAVQHKGPEV
jgi:hypothetical protein